MEQAELFKLQVDGKTYCINLAIEKGILCDGNHDDGRCGGDTEKCRTDCKVWNQKEREKYGTIWTKTQYDLVKCVAEEENGISKRDVLIKIWRRNYDDHIVDVNVTHIRQRFKEKLGISKDDERDLIIEYNKTNKKYYFLAQRQNSTPVYEKIKLRDLYVILAQGLSYVTDMTDRQEKIVLVTHDDAEGKVRKVRFLAGACFGYKAELLEKDLPDIPKESMASLFDQGVADEKLLKWVYDTCLNVEGTEADKDKETKLEKVWEKLVENLQKNIEESWRAETVIERRKKLNRKIPTTMPEIIGLNDAVDPDLLDILKRDMQDYIDADPHEYLKTTRREKNLAKAEEKRGNADIFYSYAVAMILASIDTADKHYTETDPSKTSELKSKEIRYHEALLVCMEKKLPPEDDRGIQNIADVIREESRGKTKPEIIEMVMAALAKFLEENGLTQESRVQMAEIAKSLLNNKIISRESYDIVEGYQLKLEKK